jgi:hypothetical protein
MGGTWLAKAKSKPKPLAVALTDVELKKLPDDIPGLWYGTSAIPLDTPIALSAADAGQMEDLLLIVTYKIPTS